jgi:perosamine synthetase
VEPPGARSNYWLNALLLDTPDEAARDALLGRTNASGIMTRPAWTPLHRLPMYAASPRAPLPVTEDLAARVVNLPSSPVLAVTAEAWLASARPGDLRPTTSDVAGR